ncbi:MAG: hypothetical protein ACXAD7_28365, partial [Candidatus Kariarchaeaceae archaeon]
AYKLNKNLFDLAIIKNRNTFPAWIDEDTSGLDWDLTSTQMFSYTAENFVNYKYDTNLEYIISTSTPGDVRVYTQSSYNSEPQYNLELTQMLFQTSNYGSSYTVDSYINNRITDGAQRFAFSLVPVEGNYPRNNLAVSGLLDDVDPVNNPFWLFVSSWDGDVAHQGVNQHVSFNGATDVAIFFLEETKSGDGDYPSECGTYSFSTCTYFNPLLDANDQITTLSESELSGILTPIFKQSTWLPQIAASDFIGNDVSDLVLTNGKLHLLEASHEMADDAQTDAKDNLQYRPIDHATNAGYENLDYTYKAEYFKDINDNARGREWIYANPVDLDTDGDIDLILGFARYDDANYGFDSHNYGITYFENEGTSIYPIWKELATAVNNMDTETNFAVNGYIDPQVIFNTYHIEGGVLNPNLGYHPLLKSDKPSQMLMFQSTSSTSIYPGKLKSLLADYEPPTSILAATYPSVRRLDINLKYHTTSYYNPPVSMSITTKNMGYHIMETWNNEYELRDWTLSMDTADLDGDGKNEVIVGDFNNNIIVFEHLSNNSYKRAYSSFDINETYSTDISPYETEQFDGISTTFNQTEFTHVKQLIAGFDINQNGRQEFIASTESTVYVFESTPTSLGRIRDDTYKLISVIDITDHPLLVSVPEELRTITAMTSGDINFNGKNELIIAATSTLLVYEVEIDTLTYEELVNMPLNVYYSYLFKYEEIYLGDGSLGFYNLPGNVLIHPEYNINSIL